MSICDFARLGRIVDVKECLARFENVNARDPFGRTALIWAVCNDDAGLVRLLLSAPGINVNARCTAFARTPLMWAVCCGNAELVQLLLSAPGIGVNAIDSYGYTVPVRAAKDFIEEGFHEARDRRARVLKLLLAVPGIDVNKTVLHALCDLEKVLVFPGTDASTHVKSIMAAAHHSRARAVEMLCDFPGVDLRTALSLAKAPLVAETIRAALRWDVRRGWVVVCVRQK